MLQNKPPFYSIQYEDYSYTSCLGLNFFIKKLKPISYHMFWIVISCFHVAKTNFKLGINKNGFIFF